MSDAYDPLAAKAAQAQAPAAAGYDPLSVVASGGTPANNQPQAPAQANIQPQRQSFINEVNQFGDTVAASNFNPLNWPGAVNRFVEGASGEAIGSTLGAVKGGLEGLWELARGNGIDASSQAVRESEQSSAFQPHGAAEKAGAEAASSNWNPLNWPGVVLGETGQLLGEGAEKLGAPPIVSTAAQMLPAVGASIYGLKEGGIKPGEAITPEVESVAPKSPAASGAPDGAPVEGGLPPEAQALRRAILDRVGVLEKRKSAIAGDAQAAATDYQATKFDEPAGRAMAAQFEQERNAMAAFTEGLIRKVGGSIGLDEDSLINRGSTIAAPFDALRDWFKQRQAQLYAQAQARSEELAAYGNPNAYTQLQGVNKLLQSPDFRNTIMARDQGNLLNAIQAQLQRFRETNPNGFTPAAAEQFRQWLNQIWSPETRWAVGKVKGAVDDDVLSQAGEDIYGPARAIAALKSATLDDPRAVSTLFDADPQTPINRVTPLEKIPDRIMALPVDQFANVIKTLREMPAELQDQAQAALGEIKGHLLNRLLKAGTETRSGRGAQVWKGEDVSTALARHAAKFRIAFDGDPQAQTAIRDLNSAGQILRTPEGYPGAYAQAANLSKRGVGASVVRQLGRIGGAAVGGFATGGPIGAAAGEMAGNALGEGAASSITERAALKTMRKRIETPQ